MKLRLEINQIFAKIGLKKEPPKSTIKQKQADFELKQIDGELKIDSNPVKVEIDSKRARAALHSKSCKVYSKDIARKGQETALKAIAQYTKEGDQLAAIEKNGNPLITQAKKRANSKKRKLMLKWKPGPNIKVKPGGKDISFKPKDFDGVELKTKSNWPKVDLNWGKIEVYQTQPPELEIRAVDEKV